MRDLFIIVFFVWLCILTWSMFGVVACIKQLQIFKLKELENGKKD